MEEGQGHAEQGRAVLGHDEGGLDRIEDLDEEQAAPGEHRCGGEAMPPMWA